jgi:hypothetical protein
MNMEQMEELKLAGVTGELREKLLHCVEPKMHPIDHMFFMFIYSVIYNTVLTAAVIYHQIRYGGTFINNLSG